MTDRQRDEFITRFGGVYEHSPWVAKTALDRNDDQLELNVDSLGDMMAAIVDDAGEDRQLALLRAHPDIAGRLAVQGQLTQSSSEEQKSAGLDQCTPVELAKFQSLNQTYTTKFGFPFILAVSGRNRAEILENFEARIANGLEEEFATALREVHKIAGIRLAKIFNEQI